MEKVTITLIQDYHDHKKGHTFTAAKEDGESLIEQGIAELYKAPFELEEMKSAVKEEVAIIVKDIASKVNLPNVELIKDEADKCPFKSAGEFYSHVIQQGQGKITQKMTDYVEKAPSGSNTIIDSEGGFLVPEEYSTQLMDAVKAESVLAPKTTQIPINRMIKLPAINHYDESTSWAAGVITYWVAEGASITASKPAFDQVRLELNKLAALMYVTSETLDDSAVAFEAIANTLAARAIAKQMDEEIVSGSGAGKPLGMLNAPAKIEVAKETDQLAATFNYKNALNMWQRVSNKSNAVWLMNRDVLPQYYQFSQPVGTGGSTNVVFNAAMKLPETLFGAPIIETEHCKTLGTAGDIILCDLRDYLTATKAGGDTISKASSIHVKFTTDETALRFITRADGKSWWKTALTPKNGSNTVSPIVTLAVRS